ncbi:MAG: SLBB domain-containing protein [Spirosomataceae bacterium]
MVYENKKQVVFKIRLIAVFLLIGGFVYGQQSGPSVNAVSDKELSSLIKEAESRGLTESQIETLALTRGYSQSDIQTIKERIIQLKSGSSSSQKKGNTSELARKQMGELSKKVEDTLNVNVEKIPLKRERFGKALFSNKKLAFEANLQIPTPKSYQLGASDQLKIDITGYAYQHYDATVSNEGTIKIENLSPIYVNGLTVDEAKAKIVERLKSLFAGLRNGGLTIDVTLGDVRSIQVTVIGEAASPGTYTVSSLSSLLNVIYLAGGPSDIGTMRNIQVYRDNKLVKTFDLYDLLLFGKRDNMILRNQDVILIPVAEYNVDVHGEVRRPAIYELKTGENMGKLINYAAGFTEKAYRASITVKRTTEKEREIITLSETDFGKSLVKNGDEVIVGTILDRFTNKVEVIGAVFRPGEYAIGREIQTVKQLIKAAEGTREDAFTQKAFLQRLNENADSTITQINLANILQDKEADIVLQREDKLIIKSIVELREPREIKVLGSVVNPGDFDYLEGMTVEDIILLAGGFREGANKGKVEVARRTIVSENEKNSKTTTQIYTFSPERGDDLKFKLAPFDEVYVRDNTNYQMQRKVTISGQVKYPGEYALEGQTDRISDLIARSGGLKENAFIDGAKLYRKEKLLGVNISKVIADESSSNNLVLFEGDSLSIPTKIGTVEIKGQVLNPTVVAYNSNYSFNDYISLAGGYTDSASVKKSYVIYGNGLMDKTETFLGIKKHPKSEMGMTVVVPTRKKNTLTKAEVFTLSSSLASLALVLVNLINLIQP